jgi:hypothetical protein
MMRFLEHRAASRLQWHAYKQMELIPEPRPNPADQSSPLTSGLNLLWRALLNLLVAELIAEQREVEYLDRCWLLNESDEQQQSLSNSLQRFWMLIN